MKPSYLRSVGLPGLLCLLIAGCGEASPDPSGSTLVLMGTTDVHGWLLPWDYQADAPTDQALGLLSPIIDSIRAANPGRTVLVDSGDLLQGSSMAAAFTPLAPGEVHPVIAAMNYIRYDAAALGNHEFNFGIDHLDRAISDAAFPFLSANILRAGTEEAAYPEYVILTREIEGTPIRIGVTGVLPPGVAVWDRDHVLGRLEFPDIVERLSSVVPRMKAEGADLIVVAAHNSFEGTSYDTASTGLGAENRMADAARMVPDIDVIFLGHSHEEVADSTLNGVLLLQAQARAASLAVATLQVVRDGEEWSVASSRGEILRPDPARSDPALDSLLAPAHERTLAQVNRVIGTSSVAWSAEDARIRDGALLDFVNEVQRRVTGAELSAAATFSLEAGIPAGEVTVADIARLYPYDNNLLRAIRISGADLRAYIEHGAQYFLNCPSDGCERLVNPEWPGYNFDVISGVDYTLDLTRPVGSRVAELEYGGEPVRPEQEFTLALNNYRQGGGGGFPGMTGAEVVYEGTESIRDLLVREIEERGTIRPEDYFRENWRIVPAEWHERAREEMRGRR